ncbi:hypothetical protein HYH03_001512 [Edaphochlamys debaryana]|uniref:Dihydroorotate dehydrogenase catalytic domain-containing protein n=1 Tax=Edaphochlamys debaryana TaxID=47281 RepID=A0A835YDK2_9CHLO|nr:hypothetical protein HYH03_001512 [Edaphochlamys debaryana]|eukprot:KAG2500748.1 hypothetical protein HYH03_001512 [Edaphochlamys debaryana]
MEAAAKLGAVGGAAIHALAGFELPAGEASGTLDTPTYDSYCYDIDRTWAENLASGPSRHQGPQPERVWAPEDKWFDFLGHKLASPLGVAAGPLLSSEWIELAGARGFDCVTYKTIRSHYHAGHGLPNILYLNTEEQLQAAGPTTAAPLQAAPPGSGPRRQLAITNSFGMPSRGPGEAAADIRRAAGLLAPGQMMVVSVTGTPGRPGLSFQSDLEAAARVALEGGATVIEVNLSCPNVGASHVALYLDAPAVGEAVRGLKQVVGPVPLLLKVGAYPDTDSLRRVLAEAEAAGAAGIAGINGLSRRVEAPGGGPALGPDRPTSGVCGDPIRGAGLDFVGQARQIIAADSLGLRLVGVGGVTEVDHAFEYLRAGADVVQSATGFMWRPNLGLDFQRRWVASGCSARGDGRGGR